MVMMVKKTFKKIILKKLQFGLRDYMSQLLLNEIKVEELEDIINYRAEAIVHEIRGWVYSRKVHEDSHTECIGTIKYPKDWKEAFKERWFPKWLKHFYPVKYNIHEVKLSTIN